MQVRIEQVIVSVQDGVASASEQIASKHIHFIISNTRLATQNVVSKRIQDPASEALLSPELIKY